MTPLGTSAALMGLGRYRSPMLMMTIVTVRMAVMNLEQLHALMVSWCVCMSYELIVEDMKVFVGVFLLYVCVQSSADKLFQASSTAPMLAIHP